MSNPISLGMNGVMMDVSVKAAEPQRKIMRRPYTSARRPHRRRKQPKVRL
jgi:hypothetical protein